MTKTISPDNCDCYNLFDNFMYFLLQHPIIITIVLFIIIFVLISLIIVEYRNLRRKENGNE